MGPLWGPVSWDPDINSSGRESEKYAQNQPESELVPGIITATAGTKKLTALLVEFQLVASKNEGIRLIEQGGVEIDGVRVDDARKDIDLTKAGGFLLRAGKKKFLRVVVE